ncbi:hypothetical protein BTHE_1883 [Bifidobacterium thermophilum]|nr:hypothetical protein BTHE_1883 [Bifidobacterium thermophilum]
MMGGVVMPVKNVPRETAVGRLLASIGFRSSSRMVFHVKRDDMVPCGDRRGRPHLRLSV